MLCCFVGTREFFSKIRLIKLIYFVLYARYKNR